MTDEDLAIRKNILDLMCRGNTALNPDIFHPDHLSAIKSELAALVADELVTLSDNAIQVLEKGKLFIRNISSTLDARLRRKQKEGNVFSKSI